eukprot:565331-Prorocentrum_minimum.AAC.1
MTSRRPSEWTKQDQRSSGATLTHLSALTGGVLTAGLVRTDVADQVQHLHPHTQSVLLASPHTKRTLSIWPAVQKPARRRTQEALSGLATIRGIVDLGRRLSWRAAASSSAPDRSRGKRSPPPPPAGAPAAASPTQGGVQMGVRRGSGGDLTVKRRRPSGRPSASERQPQNTTKSEEYQRQLQGVLYSTRGAQTSKMLVTNVVNIQNSQE